MPIPQLLHQTAMIFLAMLGIGFLIGFHELGHFIFCKIFRISTPSFSIGFGPRIFTKKIGETTFALSAIPLGGYVEIAGAQEVGQGEQKEALRNDEYSFNQKPYYQKMLVLAGGILFNLAFAYATLIALFSLGISKTPLLNPFNATSTIEKVLPNSPAEQVNLQPGDIILQINDQQVKSGHMKKFLETLAKYREEMVNLTIQRGGQNIPIAVQLGNGIKQPLLGAVFVLEDIPAYSFLGSIKQSIMVVNHWIISTFSAFKSMLFNKSLAGLTGPLGMIAVIKSGAHAGITTFLLILCLISVNLAVLNVIPLPIFDGGQALFYTLEAITGKSFDTVRLYIHYISWILVMVLGLYLTCKELFKMCT